MTAALNLSGQVFGRLTAVERVFPADKVDKAKKRAYWRCQCSCSTDATVVVCVDALRSGNTSSCGCLLYTKKGLSKHPLYGTWQSMHGRCYDPYSPSYPYYGARGIVVCGGWHEFENFLADMGPKPKGFTLGRRDVDADYGPENCHWESTMEQGNNRRDNVMLEYKGEVHRQAEWARLYGINSSVIATRLKFGWTMEKILATPVKYRRRNARTWTVEERAARSVIYAVGPFLYQRKKRV